MFYELIVNKNTIFYDDRKTEVATAGWRAPDDGYNVRNMLSSVCSIQIILEFNPSA
jgi:hypothetical protein